MTNSQTLTSSNNLPIYSLEAYQKNLQAVQRTRATIAILSGIVSGILGLQSLSGFSFYFGVSFFLSLCLWFISVQTESQKYFLSSFQIWFQDVLSNLFSYVLFWTLAYGIVHVY